ncbi:MAG TPA: glucosamine-6-phosphate deaminase, partial [Chitinophagaceae bacterium]
QQVDDGCFEKLCDVPIHAITLTIPTLLKASSIFCIVPGIHKAMAVFHTLRGGVDEQYPSTAIRMHPNATLFLDLNSSLEVRDE